jgi:glycine oxidase
MAQHPDVAIIGGGIIGLTSALFLAKAGAAVTVYERGDFGKEASWAGAGILPPGNPDRAATPADKLRAIGSRQFPEFSNELRAITGIDNGYRRSGGIEFLAPEDAYVPELWAAEGIEFQRLAPQDLKHAEPAVVHSPLPAYLLPFAQVRNPWHMRALLAACERVGVVLRPHEPVAGWVFEGRRVRGLRLVSERDVHAGSCVLASGAWSEPLLEPLGCAPGIHPVRGQIVLLKNHRPQLARILMMGKRYFVPRDDGRVLVGSTEEPEAKFEKWPTAAGVSELLAFALHWIPGWTGAEIEKCWAGLRPGSPDGLPFIGPVRGWDNVVVAAGHFRAGVQLSIGTARAVTELLTGKPTCVPLEAFAPDREPAANAKCAFRS